MRFEHQPSKSGNKPSDLWRDGATLRNFGAGGFVIKLLVAEGDGKKIVTAAKQPGHVTIATEVLPTVHEHHPNSTLPHRYYPAGPAEPIPLETVVTQLQARAEESQLASTALHKLMLNSPIEPQS